LTEAAAALAASTLLLATPLLLAALGELVCERAGVLNIGVEGLMLTGALAAMLGSWWSGSPWLGLAAGCIAAAVLGACFAFWIVGLDADQIVTGAALNVLAVGATGVVYRAVFGATGAALTVTTFAPVVAPASPLLAPLRQPAPVYLALLLVPLAWLVLFRTRLGLELRAVGEAPHEAEQLGLAVDRVRTAAILIGAVLAGAAGATLSLAYSNTFVEGMTAGRGFIALAIVVFGRWTPLGVLAGALVFGAASAGQFQLQAAGVAVSYHLLLLTPYVVTLALLALGTRSHAAPQALAQRRTRD
jgi:ABC-type uncharacterized transport system permease subunit